MTERWGHSPESEDEPIIFQLGEQIFPFEAGIEKLGATGEYIPQNTPIAHSVGFYIPELGKVRFDVYNHLNKDVLAKIVERPLDLFPHDVRNAVPSIVVPKISFKNFGDTDQDITCFLSIGEFEIYSRAFSEKQPRNVAEFKVWKKEGVDLPMVPTVNNELAISVLSYSFEYTKDRYVEPVDDEFFKDDLL